MISKDGTEVFEVVAPGLGASLQDRGRTGWRRFGVPPSGAMDDHAAGWANQLLDNPPDAPVIEMLLQGAQLKVFHDAWIAVTGADANANIQTWHTFRARAGEIIEFSRNRSGVWIYMAVEGGFAGERLLGSASVYPRGRIGKPLTKGDVLCRTAGHEFHLPAKSAGRGVHWEERRDYRIPPVLRVWPGPQWETFSEEDRARFFEQEWTVTAQSDRMGYRLDGEALKPRQSDVISEPVLVGSIEIPPNGLPVVTMRDGPTVGGYPKIGVLDSADVSWLAQCGPSQKVRFGLTE